MHIEFSVSGAVANNEYAFAVLPSGVRPLSQHKFTGWCANSAGNRYSASSKVATNGTVYFVARSAFVEGGFDAEWQI